MDASRVYKWGRAAGRVLFAPRCLLCGERGVAGFVGGDPAQERGGGGVAAGLGRDP